MTTTNLKKNLLILATAALVAGCHADDVSAPKDPYVPTNANNIPRLGQSFALGNQTFQEANKFFFWNQPLVPAIGAMILRAADDYDVGDDNGRIVSQQQNALREQVAAAQDQFKTALGASTLDSAAQNVLLQAYDNGNVVDTMTQLDSLYGTDYQIAQDKKDIADALARISASTKDQSRSVVDSLAQINRVEDQLASLSALPAESDNPDWLACRDEQSQSQITAQIADMKAKYYSAQSQLAALKAALPKELGSQLDAAIEDREKAYASLGDHYKQRAQIVELTDQGDTKGLASICLSKTPALTGDLESTRAKVASLLDQQLKLHQQGNAIADRGYQLVQMIQQNTEYFSGGDKSHFTFNQGSDGRIVITIRQFPSTSDDQYSTENGTIDQVKYKPLGGIIEFNVHPTRDGDYYRFRLGRIRTDLQAKDPNDKRVFYQGSMDLCKAGTICEAKLHQVIKHGVAKLGSSNN